MRGFRGSSEKNSNGKRIKGDMFFKLSHFVAPYSCPKFLSLRKAGCHKVTHSDIFIDGVSLPLSNVAIGTTGSRSGKSDRSGQRATFGRIL